MTSRHDGAGLRHRRKRLIEYIVYTGADDDALLLSPTDGRQVLLDMENIAKA